MEESPSLLETYYEERENGEIVKCWKFRGEELATKSDVFGWYVKGRAYTDCFDARSKVAIGISIASMIVSIITCIICLIS